MVGKTVSQLGHPSAALKKPTICLFTAHSPAGGGGGAILRSLVPELENQFEISWRYLATKPAAGYESGWLGTPIIGSGGFLSDAFRTASLLFGSQPTAWNGLIDKLLSAQCDAYWIVSHNEGLCIARDLQRRTSRPVHLTVHDDWAGALCARSQRYRLLKPIADRLSNQVLKQVRSADVVSKGMRAFYHERTGVSAVVVHRPLPSTASASAVVSGNDVCVGHLGSIYSKDEFCMFVEALKAFGAKQGSPVKVIARGAHLRSGDLPESIAPLVEFRPTADEAQVISELQQCRFVYAMYPFAPGLATFVKTSLPTKLSTYVMARRPILGHAPRQSTLASFIEETKLGCVWCNLDVAEGRRAVAAAAAANIDESAWEQAKNRFFGAENIKRMRHLLQAAASEAV